MHRLLEITNILLNSYLMSFLGVFLRRSNILQRVFTERDEETCGSDLYV